MKTSFRSIACVAALAVLAACGTTHDGVLTPDLSSGSSDGAQAVAPESLSGSSWRLVSLNGHKPLPGVDVTAEFFEQDRVAGAASCNRYMGRAMASDGRLEVGLLATTMMHCGETVMPQEREYLEALEAARSYAVVGNELRLSPAQGAPTLVFVRG